MRRVREIRSLNLAFRYNSYIDDRHRLYGFGDLEEKLIECIYEVTDSFCMFLCNRKPNHKTEHFFVPDASQCVVTPVLNAQFRARLQQVRSERVERSSIAVSHFYTRIMFVFSNVTRVSP